MRAVFRDPELERSFQKNGYVKIPFITDDKVKSLIQAFHDSLPLSGGTITPEEEQYETDMEITYDLTFMDRNPEYKREVFRIISEAFEEPSRKLLNDYRPIISNFIPKKSNGGEMPMHQNWAFIREERCTSVTIWVPLVDCNATNGTMALVPGSHKRFGQIRGPMIRWELEDIKQQIIEQYMVPIEAKAGEAVIIDDSIVHYTDVNKSDNLRLAIQHILIPNEETSIHYHVDHSQENWKIETLEVEQDFYMVFNPWKKPDSGVIKKVNEMPLKLKSMTIEQFGERLHHPRFDLIENTDRANHESPEKRQFKLLDKLSRFLKIFS